MNGLPRVDEMDGGYRLPLAGLPVIRCAVDQAFSLLFDDGRDGATLRIETEFELRLKASELRLAAGDAASLGPALSLQGKVVASATASKQGELLIRFQDGDGLSVGPHPRFESWGLTGSGGLRVVCLPGGGLTIWQPDPKTG